MIEQLKEKLKENRLSFEFAANENIAILERRFNPTTGILEIAKVTETNTTHIDDLIRNLEANIQPQLDEIANLKTLRPIIEKQEAKRAKEEAKQQKTTK